MGTWYTTGMRSLVSIALLACGGTGSTVQQRGDDHVANAMRAVNTSARELERYR